MKSDPGVRPAGDGSAGEDLFQAARKKAMNLLLYADRTEQQLLDRLKEQGFPEDAAEDAITYVKSYHYLDDRRYAENYLRNNRDRKSLQELRLLLSDRGISREILDDLTDDEDVSEKETVKKLFLKKYGSRDLTDPSLYQKAFRYFSGKGFKYGDIRSALEEALEEADNTDE